MTQTQSSKKPIGTYANDTILESIRGIGSSVGRTVTKDVLGQIGTDAIQSIFSSVPKAGEMKQNESISFSKRESQERPQTVRRYESMQPRIAQEAAEVRQKIDAVRHELQALAQSIKKLHQEVHNAVMDTPVNPGIYHLNYFEQLKSFLQSLRQSVEDSSTWLSSFTSRKKKQGFWGKYKKHGTSFGLSNERTMATQAG